MKFNLGDRKYADKVIEWTKWAITGICVVLCLALLMDRKILTALPFTAFTVLLFPQIKTRIKLPKYVLIIVQLLLLAMTFYSTTI